MRYIEVKIYTTQEGIDPLICNLMDLGIAGFAIEDARDFLDLLNKKNSYDWDYIDESLMELEDIPASVAFYLEETGESERSLVLLEERLNELKSEDCINYGKLSLVRKHVEDSEWKDNWKEYFKPAKISDRIVIKPTWEEYNRTGDELVIEIDPGMAFGTGTHPTTSLCVKLLERYIEPGQDTVLDVGCGSGILAIASALLGAKAVLAVDIDPVAVEVSMENLERNQLSGKIRVMEGDLTKGLKETADIVVANLMADLVRMLSKDVAAHLKGKSIYISSGILIEKQEQVVSAIEECGFHILDIMEEGEWCAIVAQI
ncbi:MAG: 50S ribosomal protein L11 methyltransferase [Eubacteriales bacterium]|nr:50S ribosomal protein L11 methyltransferase [Eubacteriales bacterium]